MHYYLGKISFFIQGGEEKPPNGRRLVMLGCELGSVESFGGLGCMYDPTVLAEIVTIGDELCRGEIIDTNGAWLAAELWEQGVTVGWISSCRDVALDMEKTLFRASGRASMVLVSGGLGPTVDDLTVDVVSAMIQAPPVVDAAAKATMDARVAKTGYKARNLDRQLRVPKGARVYENRAGAAPGFEVELGGTPVICLPGPPRELKAIYRDHLRLRIAEYVEAAGESVERIAKRTYKVFGKGESQIADMVAGVGHDVAGASIHFQVKFPECFVKIVVRAPEQSVADQRLASIDAVVRQRLSPYLYGTDGDTLPSVLGAALTARRQTLATAESCTGGMIGALVTSVAGSSAYYLGGAVTYANAEKVRQLGVSSSTLDEHGAVSEACVREMATGARGRFNADYAVAVSGVAGPGGGTKDKPVGTVWLAAAGPEQVVTKKLLWPGARDQVRGIATHAAVALVLRLVGDEVE